MTLSLSRIPGFNTVDDSLFAQDKPVLGYHLAKVADNTQFGAVRCEFFLGIYVDGDTVPLPVSAVDGYNYSRQELTYVWGIYSTSNQKTGWITGPETLWYAGWKVDQATGLVSCEEYYRRSSNNHPNGNRSNDGQLQVFTVAQRLKTFTLIADNSAIPAFPSMNTVENPENFTHRLKIDHSLIKTGMKSAVVSMLNADATHPCQITAANLVVTPAGDDSIVTATVPITFDGGSSTTSWTNSTKSTDPIPYDYDTAHDYYFCVYHPNASGADRLSYSSVNNGHPGGGISSDEIGGNNTTSVANFNTSFPFWVLWSGIKFYTAPGGLITTQFDLIGDQEFYQDRPLNTGLMTAISKNSKLCPFTTEVIYMGEFVNGDTVPNPQSPFDGVVYPYTNVFFMMSWRWTTLGTQFVQPPLSNGQLHEFNGLVYNHGEGGPNDGYVSLDVEMYPSHGVPPTTVSNYGRVAVFAFCFRNNYVSGDGS